MIDWVCKQGKLLKIHSQHGTAEHKNTVNFNLVTLLGGC